MELKGLQNENALRKIETLKEQLDDLGYDPYDSGADN